MIRIGSPTGSGLFCHTMEDHGRLSIRAFCRQYGFRRLRAACSRYSALVASAFAIASVLVVSVFQKSKQIGILKTMGAQSRQIMTIFALEGLGIALIGSTAGAILGTLIVYGLSLFERPVLRFGQAPDQLFPVRILPFYIALALLAAFYPRLLPR